MRQRLITALLFATFSAPATARRSRVVRPHQDIVIEVTGLDGLRAVELTCPGGFRDRAGLTLREPAGRPPTAVARFRGVPDEDCTLDFRGASPLRYGPLRPGARIQCDASAAGPTCSATPLEQGRRSDARPDRPGRPSRPEATSQTGAVAASSPSSSGNSAAPSDAILTLRLTGFESLTSLELVCPGGYRSRAGVAATRDADGVSHSSARFLTVPAEDCDLRFKGGAPLQYSPIRAGQTLICAPIDGTVRCGPPPAVVPSPPIHVPVASPPPPPSAAPRGRLEITVHADSNVTGLELICPGGHRARTDMRTTPARFDTVPEEACILHFKGGAPARFAPVSGGMALQCTLVSTTASCVPTAPIRTAPPGG